MRDSGAVNACIVFMWMTDDHDTFSTGAMRVLNTSMRLSGSRRGE